MDETRSLSYGITISAITAQAEEGIRNLFGMLGRLRAEAAGDVEIIADTEEASESIRDLAGDIGRLQSDADSTDIIVDADTDKAEESIRDLTGSIGRLGERSADIDIDVDTERAQTNVRDLADRVTNLGHDPPDIEVEVDTDEARRSVRDLTEDIGDIEEGAGGISSAFRKSFLAGIDSGDSFAASLRSGVVGTLTAAGEHAGALGSAFSSSFRTGIDNGNSLASSLKSGLGGALDYAENKAIDLKDNVIEGAKNIGHGFVHPIETIKSGLGNALQGAKNKFIDLARGADTAADGAEDMGDAANNAADDVVDLGNATEKSGDSAEKSGGKFEKLGGILKGLGAAVAAASVAVGAFAGSSVGVGMNFDSSMSQVAATMGYSVEELNTVGSEANKTFTELRGFAMEMGATTAFSASESADALNYMALAGYDAEKSIAMLPNVLNLAAAGGIELASASDMVTDAQSALGLTMDETSALVDKMARASSKSNTSVAQLGEAILTVGGTAKNLSGGTTELNMALGVLADNGIKGAEGGTALRNMILSLSAPTDKAAAQLKALGVEAFDAEGNLRPLNETFGDLNGALSSMTQEEQTQALNSIFNKVDLKSVNAMLGTSAERFGELTDSIENSKGAAADMADTQLDNLAGDITLFKSALEGAQIIISDELSPSLREFTQFGTESVTKLSEAFQEDGLTGAMDALGGILSDGLGMVIEMLPTAIDAGMQLLGALGQGLLDNMPLIIDAAIQIVTMLGNGILNNLPVLTGAAMQIIASLASGIGDMLPDLIPSIVETVIFVASALIENLPIIFDAGMQLISGLADGIIGAIPILIEQLPDLILSIVDFITGNLPQIAETGINLIVQLGAGLIQAIPSLVAQLPQIISAIVGGLAELPGMMLDIGKNIVEGVWNGITAMGSWIKDKISGFFGGMVDGVKGLLGIHSQSTVFTGIGDNMARGVGQGFGEGMKGVTEDIKGAISTDLDVPAPNVGTPIVPDPDLPKTDALIYDVSPDIEDVRAPVVPDISYRVDPIVGDLNQPLPTDLYYGVTPVIGDFNPPGYEKPDNDGGTPEPKGAHDDDDGTSQPDSGSFAGNESGFTFAPAFPPITITVNGNVDSEVLEEIRAMLEEKQQEMLEKCRELYEEFREEELQRAALKNQYAF